MHHYVIVQQDLLITIKQLFVNLAFFNVWVVLTISEIVNHVLIIWLVQQMAFVIV